MSNKMKTTAMGQALKKRIERTLLIYESNADQLSNIPGILGKMAMEDHPEIKSFFQQIVSLGEKGLKSSNNMQNKTAAAAGHLAEISISNEDVGHELRTLGQFADMINDYIQSQLIYKPEELSTVLEEVDIPVLLDSLALIDDDKRVQIIKALTQVNSE